MPRDDVEALWARQAAALHDSMSPAEAPKQLLFKGGPLLSHGLGTAELWMCRQKASRHCRCLCPGLTGLLQLLTLILEGVLCRCPCVSRVCCIRGDTGHCQAESGTKLGHGKQLNVV